jgi:hypothetical protein
LVNRKKLFGKIFAILMCLVGIFLLFPKLIDYIPRIKIPISAILIAIASVLILSAVLFKSQRGLFFPATVLILTSLFLIYRNEPFFPSFLNGIIIFPLIIAVAFLFLLPFEPDRHRVLIPSATFFALAGIIYFSQWELKNISKFFSKYMPLGPIDFIAILLIFWGIYRLFKS